MVWLLFAAALLIPAVLALLQARYQSAITRWLDGAAWVCSIVFGTISAWYIYRILRDEQVFMTTVHGIFLNPWFLLTGAYLGLYMIYRLLGRVTGIDKVR